MRFVTILGAGNTQFVSGIAGPVKALAEPVAHVRRLRWLPPSQFFHDFRTLFAISRFSWFEFGVAHVRGLRRLPPSFVFSAFAPYRAVAIRNV